MFLYVFFWFKKKKKQHAFIFAYCTIRKFFILFPIEVIPLLD